MNKLLKMSLALIAISSSLQANPLTYPDAGKWNYSAGAGLGPESFHVHYTRSIADGFFLKSSDVYGSAIALGLNQSVGYGSWFYLQARESVSLGTESMLRTATFTGDIEPRLKGIHFFDADIRAYFPLSLSERERVTLQPVIGFGIHLSSIKSQDTPEGVEYTGYKSKSFSPLLGLALGIEPTDAFSLRLAYVFEVTNFRHKLGNSTNETNWEHLGMHRLGTNASLDLNYSVSHSMDITGSVNYQSYSLVGVPHLGDNSRYDFAFSSRVGVKAGARWNF